MSVIDDMLTILRADTVFAGLMPGGVFDRPLDPSDPVTNVAWAAHPLTGVKRLRPAAVMLPPQEVDHPFGLNPGRRVDFDLWPDLYLYAEGDGARDILDQADERAMALLHEHHIGLAEVRATGHRAAPLEAPELPGHVIHSYRRFRIVTVRHIQEV
jgi:hypothetical protein